MKIRRHAAAGRAYDLREGRSIRSHIAARADQSADVGDCAPQLNLHSAKTDMGLISKSGTKPGKVEHERDILARPRMARPSVLASADRRLGRESSNSWGFFNKS